jgi:toxin ParE1/3/4
MSKQLIVTFAESAVADIEQILEWYREQQVPDVGKKIVSEIVAKAEALQDYPDMGRVVPEFGRDNLRESIHSPFRIVYKRDANCVRIVRVWRSERLLKPAE